MFHENLRSFERSAARAFSVLSFGVALLAGCAAPGAETKPGLVCASDLDNPPFAFVDAAGQPAGRDVEMMEELANGLGCRLEWRRMPFEELLPAAAAGEVDVVCATLGITEERAKAVLFTEPYFVTTVATVVRVGPGEPETPRELAGLVVAAGAGTTSERAARRRLTESRLAVEEEGALSGAERLITRAVDALVMDGPAAEAFVRSGGGRFQVQREPLAIERYALALPKHKSDLRAALDLELGVLREAGRLAELNDQYQLAEGHVR